MSAVQPWRSIHGENRIDLDGGGERKARAANGDARVAPLVAENLDEEIRGAVQHFGMVGEVGRCVDKAVQAQQLDDAVEIAQGRLRLRQYVERAEPRGLLALSEIGVGAQLASERHLAVLHGKLA